MRQIYYSILPLTPHRTLNIKKLYFKITDNKKYSLNIEVDIKLRIDRVVLFRHYLAVRINVLHVREGLHYEASAKRPALVVPDLCRPLNSPSIK